MKKLLLTLVVFVAATSFGQTNLWRKLDNKEYATLQKLDRTSIPSEFDVYAINLDALKTRLAFAPSRSSGQTSGVLVTFPNAEGQMQNFRVYASSVMHPDLAARHQEIKTYIGECVEDKTASIHFTTTIFGLHTMTLAADKSAAYIDPYSKDLNHYMVFSKASLTTNRVFQCGYDDNAPRPDFNLNLENPSENRSENGLFKTYRLAFSCTIEYAAYHVNAANLNSGTLAQKKAAVLAAQAVTVARVNSVYEKDFAITLQLIANNTDIINITSDNLDNNNAAPTFPLLGQNQTLIDTVIGDANYDIGHVATTGAGGVASQGPCQTGSKARGVTGIGDPVGDQYDIDYVAHEMGHQFGAAHTYNNSCGGNVAATSAFEPGSGSTIMAYAGICPPNVQNNSDAYFHARSILQVQNYINGVGNCGVILPNNNAAPVIAPLSNFTIPFGTPFFMEASVTDADGDALTYCWEQYNANSSTQPPVATATVGPNYRSLLPTTSPRRYFPKQSDVLNGVLSTTWEVTPTVARTMLMRVMVRDNEAINGGQTKTATSTITFSGTAGPFTFGSITGRSVNAIFAWEPGQTKTITWNVNNTNTLPGGANVNIKFSIDGGLTFPYDLILNTPNDGSEDIIVPVTPASLTCRILIEATGSPFYTVNPVGDSIYTGYTVTNECNTYNYTGAAFAIPDGSGNVAKTIAVPASNNVTDVNVTINATHPNLQNLIIAMIRPGSGTQYQLFNQQCSANANMNVTFDQQAPALVCASPTSGTYAPSGSANLNLLTGNFPAGNFAVNFRDVVATNAGTVNAMSVEICKATTVLTSTLANENFEFKDFALYPNPTNDNFTIRFNSNSTNKIAVSVADISGRKILEKSFENAGLFEQNIQLEKAQAGVYLVSIADGDKKIVKRIVIE